MGEERLAWLAGRLSRKGYKESSLDVIELASVAAQISPVEKERNLRLEVSLEL